MSDQLRLAIAAAILDAPRMPTHYDVYKALCRKEVIKASPTSSLRVIAVINEMIADGSVLEIDVCTTRFLDLPVDPS